MRRLWIPVFLGCFVGACGILGPDEFRRVIGDIGRGHPEDVFAVPDSVLVAEAFKLSFRTYGYYGDSKGETHVRIQGNVATITPYDYYRRKNREPIRPFLGFSHEATVRFVEVGEAQVILRVRIPDGRTKTSSDTIEVKKTMRVYSR